MIQNNIPSNRNVDSLVRANFFAQLADQLTLTAIPLIAVLYLNLGAGGVGLLNTFQTLPYLILSIPLGVLVDRLSKKKVIQISEIVRIASLVAIVFFTYFEMITFWGLVVLGFLASVGSVGFNAALPAYLPTLVEKSRLTFYNGRLELVRSLGVTLGPALAGAIAAWFGASNAFIIGIILTVLTLSYVYSISHSGKVDNSDTEKNPLRDIARGAKFIRGNTQLSTIMLVAFVWNCGWFVLQAAFMPLAIKTWGLSSEVIGYSLGCMGLGLLVGSFFSQKIINGLGFGLSLTFGPVLSFIASLLILVNVQYETAILPAIAFFIFGFGPVIWIITSNTLRQVVTPAHMIGCVSAMYMTANWGARPFGALLGAAIGAYYGAAMCLYVCAALYFIQMVLVFITGLAKSSLDVSAPEAV